MKNHLQGLGPGLQVQLPFLIMPSIGVIAPCITIVGTHHQKGPWKMSQDWAVENEHSKKENLIWYANVCRIHVWDILST